MNLRTVISSLCLVALAACPRPSDSPQDAPTNLVLRTYEVPKGTAQQLRSTLQTVLWLGGENKDANKYAGRADVTPDGRLLVLAPENVQEGVKALVSSVSAAPAQPDSVRLEYWVVRGTPGKSEVAANLHEVAPALKEVEQNDGEMTFALVEKLAVRSQNGESGRIGGRDTHLEQFIRSTDNGVVLADVRLERFAQKLDTRVKLQPGALVVLASAGMTSPDNSTANSTIYFVVRAALGDVASGK